MSRGGCRRGIRGRRVRVKYRQAREAEKMERGKGQKRRGARGRHEGA